MSDVTEECISFADAAAAASVPQVPAAAAESAPKTKAQAREELSKMNTGRKKNIITRLGIGVGSVVNKFYQAGR